MGHGERRIDIFELTALHLSRFLHDAVTTHARSTPRPFGRRS